MSDLSSVVPALRFAATMGYYLIEIWNPKEIFFGKSSGQNPPLVGRASPLRFFLSFFLSWVSKTQPNHWTKAER